MFGDMSSKNNVMFPEDVSCQYIVEPAILICQMRDKIDRLQDKCIQALLENAELCKEIRKLKGED